MRRETQDVRLNSGVLKIELNYLVLGVLKT
jgi:hypothetical protein